MNIASRGIRGFALTALLLAVGLSLLTSCSEPPRPRRKKRDTTAAKVAEAKTAFTKFCDEAIKMAAMMENRPSLEKVLECQKKLGELRTDANSILSDNAELDAIDKRCGDLLRFFDACRKNIQFPVDPNVKERPWDKIYEYCAKNGAAARETAEEIKQMIHSDKPAAAAPAAKDKAESSKPAEKE